ncbi:MAG: DUF2779 domain-containing protein [Caulobacterales bacterium]|nr:DUF2779 domain-containing protein [Caulobacterales bacterium]
MNKIGLSKSKITMWRQCPKRLWLDKYKKNEAKVGSDIAARMDVGHKVGEIAQSLFPGGFLVDDEELSSAIKTTKQLLSDKPKQPIFEATLEHDGLLVRADLLVPTKKGYRLIEVKSSGGMKDYYRDDFTVQKWVFDKNGVEISGVELGHIDTSFIYQGDGNYSKLLKFQKVDVIVEENIDNVEDWVKKAREVLNSSEPKIECGKHCYKPFECPFIEYCSPDTPEDLPKYGVDMYSRLTQKTREELEIKGIVDGLLVPDEYLNSTNKWIKAVTLSGEYELNDEAKAIINKLPHPRYYFDFETIAFAIPKWAQTRPFQQIPFQWSCHIENGNGDLVHHDFLDISGNDPRRACAEKMIEIMGTSGPVIVYNQSFEMRVISELAALFPDLSKKLLAINARAFDLLPIMRNHYYHPEMYGSWSIKAVLPTIAPELSYENMEVGNGGDAQEAYLEIISPETPKAQSDLLVTALLAYCKKDTFAMVKIVEFIEGN